MLRLQNLRKPVLLGVVGAVLAAVVLALRLFAGGQGGSATFRTVPVAKGDLFATISATGTVEPEEVVDVGAQVAGKILAFGKDAAVKTVDYGSRS